MTAPLFSHRDFRKPAKPVALPDDGATPPTRHATAAEVGERGELPAHEAPFNLLMLRDYMIEMVAALWSEPTAFMFPEQPARKAFLKLPTEPGERTTAQHNGIFVTSAQAWKPESPDFLPAIYVAVGDGTLAAPSGTGPKQMATQYVTELSEVDYETHASGVIRFVHEANEEAETMALVSNTLDMLTAFAPIIRKDWCFVSFDVAGWTTPVHVGSESKPERFKGVVTCAYTKSQRWTLRLIAPRLKRLKFFSSLHTS